MLKFTGSTRYMASLLPIIFLKEFIKLKANMDIIIKNVKHIELNVSTATVFLHKL